MRFSGVDVTAAVSDLQKTKGLRAANIYNVGAKAYIFKVFLSCSFFSILLPSPYLHQKLHQTDDTRYLLVEAGIRVHVTKFSREKPAVPSPFTVKLRRFEKCSKKNERRKEKEKKKKRKRKRKGEVEKREIGFHLFFPP